MRQLKITKQVTNRETASLDKYLQEIGKVDLITADEEVELAQRIKAGDQRALEKLTKAKKISKEEEKKVGFELSLRTFKELQSIHPKIHLMSANNFELISDILR